MVFSLEVTYDDLVFPDFTKKTTLPCQFPGIFEVLCWRLNSPTHESVDFFCLRFHLFSLIGLNNLSLPLVSSSPLGQYILQPYFKGLLLITGNDESFGSLPAVFHYSLLPVEVLVRILKRSGYTITRRREERRGKI